MALKARGVQQAATAWQALPARTDDQPKRVKKVPNLLNHQILCNTMTHIYTYSQNTFARFLGVRSNDLENLYFYAGPFELVLYSRSVYLLMLFLFMIDLGFFYFCINSGLDKLCFPEFDMFHFLVSMSFFYSNTKKYTYRS